MLQHYNPHYNIALVGVKDFHASCPAKIQRLSVGQVRRGVAVGYCFETCKFFARSVSLDCKQLGYSTCKISKVLLLFLLISLQFCSYRRLMSLVLLKCSSSTIVLMHHVLLCNSFDASCFSLQ